MGCSSSKAEGSTTEPSNAALAEPTEKATGSVPAPEPAPEPAPAPTDISAAPAAASTAPEWKPDADAVYHRLTPIKIKEGALPDVKAVFTSEKWKDMIKTKFPEVVGLEAYSIDETTMFTNSMWPSEEACSSTAQALGPVIKEYFSEMIAGPPDPPWTGPQLADIKLAATGPITAYRLTILKIQEGTLGSMPDILKGHVPAFNEIEGFVKLTIFVSSPTSVVILAGYSSKAHLEAATPKIGEILGGMKSMFTAPPEFHLATVEYNSAAAFSTKPVLHYFDVNGRGELSKLIAAVGSVEIEVVEYPFAANGASAADKLKAGNLESEHTKAAKEMGMEGCGLPILMHDDLKLYQSFACQNYLASIGPNYPKVSPAELAIDNMFEGALEDAMGLAASVVLSGGDPSLVPVIMEKILTHLTKYIPAEGFIHSKDSPSTADLCVLVLTQALVPFGATLGEGAAECYGKFPAAVALGERAAAFPAVAKWLENDHCNLKKPPKAAR